MNTNKIDKDKFVFASNTEKIMDQKLDTKSRSYLQDALFRFTRNKASIVASVIIAILVLFSLIIPVVSPYSVSFSDDVYMSVLPRNQLFVDLKIPFWDGGSDSLISSDRLSYYLAINEETGLSPIMHDKYEEVEVESFSGSISIRYDVRLDTYDSVGVQFLLLTRTEYENLQKYQDESGVQVIYPITERTKRPTTGADSENANYWYETSVVGTGATLTPTLDSEGNLIDIYLPYTGGADDYTSKLRVEGEGNFEYDYALRSGSTYQVRVLYKEYFSYYYSNVQDTRINTPTFLFGTTDKGKDIFTCLATGARFSLMLGVIVAVVNFCIGIVYGAIQGYYGGKRDLLMSRICEIVGSIPMMIVITLLKFHFESVNVVLLLLLSFFITGWMGIAGITRMQFYRFKNQEYILAARTLGASDKRIMIKHIFPNAIGTLITSSVLTIPGVIFAETSLSYLGIINLDSKDRTSVGTLLAGAQGFLSTYPHMMIFPALVICLLMLSFNLFGNGLRDAFNPSLRGTE